jgi:hypothetical protein
MHCQGLESIPKRIKAGGEDAATFAGRGFYATDEFSLRDLPGTKEMLGFIGGLEGGIDDDQGIAENQSEKYEGAV